jgi:hypothetical protein
LLEKHFGRHHTRTVAEGTIHHPGGLGLLAAVGFAADQADCTLPELFCECCHTTISQSSLSDKRNHHSSNASFPMSSIVFAQMNTGIYKHDSQFLYTIIT